MLISSGGCSRGECVPVLRGSEVLYRVARDEKAPLLLRVELAPGQEERDVHPDGWYVSNAQMSRIYAALEVMDAARATEKPVQAQ